MSTYLAPSSPLDASPRLEPAIAITRALLDESVGLHLISDVPLGIFLSGGIDSSTLLELNHYLQNQLLKDADFMSMAHSIETRVPYLDHRLVEHVLGLPARRELRNGMNKPLLVKALGDDLPREVWNRPKMGFTFPFGKWMGEQAEELEARSLAPKLLDRKALEDIWKGFREGRVHRLLHFRESVETGSILRGRKDVAGAGPAGGSIGRQASECHCNEGSMA